MRRIPATLLGGVIAGAVDITYAIAFSYFVRGTPPTRLLQLVASGLLGARAYEGGLATAGLGLALHFLIALLWAALFVAAAAAWPSLARRAAIAGPLYGLLIYAAMNLVVLPLSAFPHPVVFRALPTITGLIVHALGIGLPIALCARRSLHAEK